MSGSPHASAGVPLRTRAVASAASPAGVAVGVFVLGAAAVLLTPEGSQIAAWWPAAGVAAAAVATSVGNRRRAMLVAVALASFLANLAGGRPPVVAGVFAVVNTAEAAVVGHLLGRDGRPRLVSMSDLGRLLAATAIGAMLTGALVAAADHWLLDDRLDGVWWAVAASHGSAILLLVPLVMRLPARHVAGSRAELAGLWAAVPIVVLGVFAPGQLLPLTFLPVAALVWTGLRFGLRTAVVQLLVVGVLTAVLTAHGGGPFAHAGRLMSPATAAVLVQLFLLACALVVLVLAVSVAQREAAIVELADQRRFDQGVLEAVNAAVLACGADGTIVVRNAAHRRITGMTDRESDRSPLRRGLAGEELTDLPLRIGPAGMPLHDVLVTARQIRGDDGRLLGAVAACTDVTAERAVQGRLRDSLAFRDAVLAASPDLIYIVDVDSRSIVWASRPPAEMFGHADLLAHPDDIDRLRTADLAARDLADGEVLSLRYRVCNDTGHYRWFTRRVTPFVREDDGRPRQLLGVVRDITEIVEVEERLAEAALHDPLTGLPNRRLLTDRLDAALSAGGPVVVLFCDLDGFKHVNDTAGHAVGDAVLAAAAARLRAVLRPCDLVARVGGDEFVIILTSTAGNVEQQAHAVARRVTRSLAQPVDVDGIGHAVTVSVGVTIAHTGDVPEDVLRDADAAMYLAKARGKDRHAVFDDTLRADVGERRRVHGALRAALSAPAAGCLSVAYQPMVDLGTQQLAGVEALARLTDGQRNSLGPDVFIPIAEDTGLIAPLGRHVLDTACADLAAWHARHPGWRQLGVSVNLSARQADLTDLVAEVEAALHRTGLAAPLLTVELTESVLIEAGHSTITALHELRELGVKIAIDDFGTGYASLRHLAQLPITGVKIDRSFVSGLPDDPTCSTIVRTIATLARDLGLSCVAEGIETDAQLLALPHGLVGQGYLLGRPAAAAEIDGYLTDRALQVGHAPR